MGMRGTNHPPNENSHQREGKVKKTRLSRAFLATALVAILISAIPATAQDIKRTDLGTLGGTESKAVAVNDSGQIVGFSRDFYELRQAFLINPQDTDGDEIPDLWFRDADGDGANDLMINLSIGELDAGALGINNSGQVFGRRKIDEGVLCYFLITPLDTNSDGTPDLWYQDNGAGRNGRMEDIIASNGCFPVAIAVNDLGQVVGFYGPAAGQMHAFLWSHDTGVIDLGTLLPNDRSIAVDINSRGQVIGGSFASGSGDRAFVINPLDRNQDRKPDLWFQDVNLDAVNDLMTDPGQLGGNSSDAADINEHGEIAGTSEDSAGVGHAFLWTETGGLMDLGAPGGFWCQAVAINDRTKIAGYDWHDLPGADYAFYWSEGDGIIDLGPLGADDSIPWAMNNLGQIVGSTLPKWGPLLFGDYMDPPIAGKLGIDAFVWSKKYGLLELAGFEYAWETQPFDINDNELIAGYSYCTGKYTPHAVLWEIYNTKKGDDVVVKVPEEPKKISATVKFEQVTESGKTTLEVIPLEVPPPSGFKPVDPVEVYEIKTTAKYTGQIEICFDYSGLKVAKEENLKLFHNENGQWMDITTSLEKENKTICGVVSSLSAFALFELDVEAEGFQEPLAALVPSGEDPPLPDVAFKKGRTLPLKLQLFAGDRLLTDADVVAPKIVGLIRTGDAIPIDMYDLDSGQANDSGPYFRFSDGQWVYNLGTKRLSSGTYKITLELPDGDRVCAGFVLR